MKIKIEKQKKFRDMTEKELKTEIKMSFWLSVLILLMVLSLSVYNTVQSLFFNVAQKPEATIIFVLGIAVTPFLMIQAVMAQFELRIREVAERISVHEAEIIPDVKDLST